MTAAEAQPWLAGLEQVTGYRWEHRVDHRARDEFRLVLQGYELHLWSTGRWAVYKLDGTGVLQPASRPFQEALNQIQAELHRRLTAP